MQPKVSVIVPVYNTEKYLGKCLDSLVNQTLQEIEIVVIDDGSTDSSSEIIREYQSRYPEKIVVFTQKNSGQGIARNKGLKLCNGEYIGFLDSDDFVKVTMFGQMYDKAKKNNADYVACGYTDITYQDNRIIELKKYISSKVAKSNKDMFFGALASPFIHLYQREILNLADATFTEGKIYEDTAFYLKVIPHIRKIAVIEEPLAYRVRHKKSTTASISSEKVNQIFSVLDDTIAYYCDHNLWDEYKDELTYFCVKILLCSSMMRIFRVQDKKSRKLLVNDTITYIEHNFENYRNNLYLKKPNAINFYMRSFNKKTAEIYGQIFQIRNRMRRNFT